MPPMHAFWNMMQLNNSKVNVAEIRESLLLKIHNFETNQFKARTTMILYLSLIKQRFEGYFEGYLKGILKGN